jgi:hypothetical protein
MAIDRTMRAATGALALRRVGKSWDITAARPDGYDRPWARAAAAARPVSGDQATPPSGPAGRDATPRSEDLDAGD